jgi:hypothetical protein
MGRRDERGAALVVVLLLMLLIGALAAALALTTTVETTIAGNYRRLEQGRAAAEAVLERALVDLAAAPDWTPVLAGLAQASFTDGPPSGVRVLTNGERIDLDLLVSMANCRRPRPCTAAELTQVTAARPWGPNNPGWRLYAYGALGSLDPAPGGNAAVYVVALVGDDPSEVDGDPQIDGGGPAQEGFGRAVVTGYAVGPRGDRMAVQATVARLAPNGLQVLAWTPQPSGL